MKLAWKILLFFGIVLCGVEKTVQQEDINGNWSPWSVYGTECSKPCGGGIQMRRRSCSNPHPEGTGQKCLKLDNSQGTIESKNFECNKESCWEGNFTNCECENCTIGRCQRFAKCGPSDEDVCTGDQEQSMWVDCNTWNKTTCPSPCLNVTCPEFGVCKDHSTEEKPMWRCMCTMGYLLSDDKSTCIRPPPTLPTKRPIPTLPEGQKTVATAVTKTASVVLIIFVGITLLLFLILRVFTSERVIQMNMEIAILLAHCLLMFPSTTYKKQIMCKIISVLIHFFFTACFSFMLLEAIHMYSLVAYVVKRDGMLTRLQNIMTGWGLSAIIVIFCICFEYKNYGGEYHCWLQMDTNLMLGQLIPIAIITIVTLTLIEAAGASSYKPLNGIDMDQFQNAKISQRSNLIILFFVITHMLIGMYSEYEQNLGLYGTFAILNGITGGLIFFFHCSGNQKIRGKFMSCFRSVTKKK